MQCFNPPRAYSVVPMLGKEVVTEASKVVYRYCIRTPLYRDFHLSRLTGLDVRLKLELYQPVRSFKIRGAANKLSRISQDTVITASSGNHGIAVAYMAAMLGKKAVVVLPQNVNPSKLQMIKDMGAEVAFSGTTSDERIKYASDYSARTGIPLIPSFDDPEIIGGQGTIGLEMQEQMDLDAVLCPIGGGGLISGIALSYAGNRSTSIMGVQAEGAQSMNLSVHEGKPVTSRSETIADGIMVSTPGAINVSIVKEHVRGILLVSDEEIVEAVKEMWNSSHLLIEPASASTVAALKRYGPELVSRGVNRVALIITGGNVSDKVFRMIAAV